MVFYHFICVVFVCKKEMCYRGIFSAQPFFLLRFSDEVCSLLYALAADLKGSQMPEL